MNGPQEPLSEETFFAALQRLDALIQSFEQLPLQRVQEQAFALLQAVDTVHRAGLQQMVARLREGAGEDAVRALYDDPVVHTLLLLYDLAPITGQPDPLTAPPATAATGAQAPAGDRSGARVIGLGEIQVKGSRPIPGLRAPRFTPVGQLQNLPPGAVQPAAVDEVRALVANVDGELYAVGELCPGSDLSLLFGDFEGALVTCSWHGETFDIRSGRCVDPAGREDRPRLPVYPLRVVGDEIQIAVGSGPPEGEE